jgi:hypothetical protein
MQNHLQFYFLPWNRHKKITYFFLTIRVHTKTHAICFTQHREHDDESDLELEEASGDWSRDEMSNEAGGSDQNNSWYIGQFKGRFTIFFLVLLIQHC